MTDLKLHQSRLEVYIHYFETLTPASIDDLDQMAAKYLVFQDPFNRVTNRADVKRLFQQMFDDVEDPAFKIIESYWGQDGQTAILKWRFTGNARKIGRLDFEGLSEIEFDEAGLITSHIDYWDAASHFYEKIPIIGALLRMIRKKLRLS